MSRNRVPGKQAYASVEVSLTEEEREAFVAAAKAAGFVRPGTDKGAAGAWLRSLGFAELQRTSKGP